MDTDKFDEELSMMYEKASRIRVLDSDTFTLPVKALPVRRPVSVKEEDTLQQALEVMKARNVGCVLVIRSNGTLSGILTERDVIRKGISSGVPFNRLPVHDIMTPGPETVQPDDTIAMAMNAMHLGGYRHLPVVNEEHKPLAVISVKDLVTFIVENFSEDILNIPPRQPRRTPQQDGG
jgi:CBS domain-containing protein